MNVIFMGTPSFAVPSLEKLLASPHTLLAVITSPDKTRGRGLMLSESEVKKSAKNHSLKILQPESLKDDKFVKEIENLKPDLIVVVAFRILPKEIFTIPSNGSINLHASLLPKYRGAAPINWAIIKGEKETGVTTFFLQEKVDTGNIILQNKCEINNDDDAGSLHDKLAQLGADTVLSTVKLIENSKGSVPVYKQDNTLATSAPKITPDLCKINWNDSVINIYNFIRGLSPYPAAYTFNKGNRIKIFKTCIVGRNAVSPANQRFALHSSPGEIVISNDKLYVTCTDGLLEILELQLEGKKRITAKEFMMGYKIQIGENFQ